MIMSLLMSAAAVVLAVLAAPGPGVAHAAEPARNPGKSPGATPGAPRVRVPSAPGLTISITDGHDQARPGELLRYTVRVQNGGAATVKDLVVTLTFPSYLRFVSASPAGRAVGGHVSWPARALGGGAVTFTMSARLGRTPPGVARLAAVTCATGGGKAGGGQTTVCAAHLDRLPGHGGIAGPSSGGGTGPAAGLSPPRDLTGYGLAGLAVVATIALAALTTRWIRARRPRGLRHRHSA